MPRVTDKGCDLGSRDVAQAVSIEGGWGVNTLTSLSPQPPVFPSRTQPNRTPEDRWLCDSVPTRQCLGVQSKGPEQN